MSGSIVIHGAYYTHTHIHSHTHRDILMSACLHQHNRMKASATFDVLQENGKKDLKFNEFLFLRTPACHIKEDIWLICQGGTGRGGGRK